MYYKVVLGKINFLFRIRSQLTAAMKSMQIVSIVQLKVEKSQNYFWHAIQNSNNQSDIANVSVELDDESKENWPVK